MADVLATTGPISTVREWLLEFDKQFRRLEWVKILHGQVSDQPQVAKPQVIGRRAAGEPSALMATRSEDVSKSRTGWLSHLDNKPSPDRRRTVSMVISRFHLPSLTFTRT